MALVQLILEADAAHSLFHQRVFRDRLNPLDSYNDCDLSVVIG